MDIFSVSTSADGLMSAINNQSSQMESLANQALSNGIDKYTNQDYAGAAQEFKRAVGLSPYSDYAEDATKYLAMAYMQLDETEKAIRAYKDSIQLHPDSDVLQIALGNLLFGEERYAEAEAAYKEAVRIYPDVNNRFALGQVYLKLGRYDDSEFQFLKVIENDPQSPNGYFGLGQALSAQKKYTEAIQEFERALQKNKDFYDAYAEMGYTYADAGNMDKAWDIQKDLEYTAPQLAETLGEYVNKVTEPKILFAWTTGSFQFYLPPKTEVSALHDYLANANATQTLTMEFQFNKAMDRESVENTLNWSIRRSSGHGPGKDYNFNLPIPSTEVTLPQHPINVYYDEIYYSATISFTITQNANADGTIDPSHIEFAYSGVDADGNELHTEYDQFIGFSGHI